MFTPGIRGAFRHHVKKPVKLTPTPHVWKSLKKRHVTFANGRLRGVDMLLLFRKLLHGRSLVPAAGTSTCCASWAGESNRGCISRSRSTTSGPASSPQQVLSREVLATIGASIVSGFYSILVDVFHNIPRSFLHLCTTRWLPEPPAPRAQGANKNILH